MSMTVYRVVLGVGKPGSVKAARRYKYVYGNGRLIAYRISRFRVVVVIFRGHFSTTLELPSMKSNVIYMDRSGSRKIGRRRRAGRLASMQRHPSNPDNWIYRHTKEQ